MFLSCQPPFVQQCCSLLFCDESNPQQKHKMILLWQCECHQCHPSYSTYYAPSFEICHHNLHFLGNCKLEGFILNTRGVLNKKIYNVSSQTYQTS